MVGVEDEDIVEITAEVMLHLLDDDDGVVKMILKKIGADVGQLTSMVESQVGRLPQGNGGSQLMPDPVFNQIVLDGQNRADAMGDEYLSVEHLFISLASVQSDAKEVLQLNSITAEQIESVLKYLDEIVRRSAGWKRTEYFCV